MIINLGTVQGCKVHQVVTDIKCPLCGQKIPTENIIAVGFLQCTAQIKNAQGVKIYLIGSSQHLMPLDLSWEIDIFPLSYRQVSTQNLLVAGMNIQAVCSHLECEARKTQNGRIFISGGELKHFKLGEVLKKLSCPSCKSSLSVLAMKSLTFMRCRALIETSGKEYLIETGENEVIDLEIELLTPESSILILDLDQKFPEGVKKVSIDSGEFSYKALCRGVNFRASCPNPSCVSSQKHHFVNIMAGHLINFDYRAAVRTLLCPSCGVHIPPEQVKGVHLLECVGKIQIDDKIQEITANKNNVQSIDFRNDGSEVKITITQRVYNIDTVPLSRFTGIPYKRLCNGLNFCCYCKNPSCPAVKEGNGLVFVRRDNTFARANNYSNTVCNYIEEVSNLFCPACLVPLKKYYVWGIGVTRCTGKIMRDGSPPKTFNPWFGKVALYALDRDDVSVLCTHRVPSLEQKIPFFLLLS